MDRAALYSAEHLSEAQKVVKEYAAEAERITKSVISKDTVALRILAVVEDFLREKKRILYGGAAINALLPKADKFYDPTLDLPDYDFLTPDGLDDCAHLVEKYKNAGFTDVEVRLGIHEGTYKVFVAYRAAADITEIPADVYAKLHKKARKRNGLYCAPPDWLRMNAYLELSRPAGDVSRWEKVFGRLQLLNKAYPLSTGSLDCATDDGKTRFPPSKRRRIHSIILQAVSYTRTLFLGSSLEGIFKMLAKGEADLDVAIGRQIVKYDPRYVLLTETLLETTNTIAAELKAAYPTSKVSIQEFSGKGEILAERSEILLEGRRIATIFPTIACSAFYTLTIRIPKDEKDYIVRVASIDTAITMLYSLWFTGLQRSVGKRILCLLQALLDIEAHLRLENPRASKISLFPFSCLGKQPSLVELKKHHRERIKEKKDEIHKLLESTLKKTSSSKS